MRGLTDQDTAPAEAHLLETERGTEAEVTVTVRVRLRALVGDTPTYLDLEDTVRRVREEIASQVAFPRDDLTPWGRERRLVGIGASLEPASPEALVSRLERQLRELRLRLEEGRAREQCPVCEEYGCERPGCERIEPRRLPPAVEAELAREQPVATTHLVDDEEGTP